MNTYRALWRSLVANHDPVAQITFGEMRASGVLDVLSGNDLDHCMVRCSDHPQAASGGSFGRVRGTICTTGLPRPFFNWRSRSFFSVRTWMAIGHTDHGAWCERQHFRAG